MKHTLYLLLLLFSIIGPFAYSQPCIQGNINIYSPVIDFECSGNTVVVQSSSGFQPNDLVLLIQMKGATCNLENTITFGDLSQLNNAGNYEINRIQSIQGNKIAMQFMRTRDYNLDGKVQLIRIPEYSDVNVCNLTCQAWNGETGGVLILKATGQLTLNGPIDASAKGFRGGLLNNAALTSNHETGFFYAPDANISAAKGEGIVSIANSISYGRGKAINGGGGGNAHNSGGGGGGSFGNGGRGGTEFSHTVPDPNTFGIGGLNLASNNTRIFMGGGGGAGHTNDFTGTSGGNGGGIVIILAQSIVSNGFPISSNGQNILGGSLNNDGQGGGGSGGTIAVYAETMVDNLTVEAHGGTGGNSIFLSTPAQKIGPGGGGGGGGLLLYHNTTGVTGTFSGGPHGVTNGQDAYGAQDGAPGFSNSNLQIPLDTVVFNPVNEIVLMHPGCQSLSNGSIQVNVDASSFTLDGQTNTTGFFDQLDTGTYLITLQLADGCVYSTSAVLSSEAQIMYDTSFTICTGGTLVFNGNTYDVPGVYTDTLFSSFGACDTLLTIHISQAGYVLTFDTYKICPGYSININGVEFNAPGILIDTIPGNSTGCDTIHKTSITWDFTPKINQVITFCPGDTLYFDTVFFTMPFVHVDTLPASAGCDTIRTITGVFFSDQPEPFLGPAITFCPGDELILQSPYPQSIWNNEFSGSNFSVTSAGLTTLFYTDNNGCSQHDSIMVRPCCNIETIYIPNVFSPGNNSLNNRFIISSTPFCTLLRLQIYNRWGALIFQTDTPEEGWDGIFKGKYCEPDVYIWILETAQTYDLHRKELLKGDVTILR